MLNRSRLAFQTLVSLSLAVAVAWAEQPNSEPGNLERACELGITLALQGKDAGAESIFVSILSRKPRDARALNNLGNLHLWRGDPEVALLFYERALQIDSLDAGIALNEATALMLAGEEEAAQRRAAEGVRMAGGAHQAAGLLGLKLEETGDAPKAAERTHVNREEVLELLHEAARSVPPDSTRAPQEKTDEKRDSRQRAPAWRSAGARGSEATDLVAIVYWKR